MKTAATGPSFLWERACSRRSIVASQLAPTWFKPGGFTLIEVLLALALLAALLLSINQFVFSITEAWTKNQDQFIFVQHTRAVTRHLDELLVTAATGSRGGTTAAGAPAFAEMRLPEGGTADLLAFDLPKGDRLFTWPATPLPEVQCALAWRKEDGLVLYWKSHLVSVVVSK